MENTKRKNKYKYIWIYLVILVIFILRHILKDPEIHIKIYDYFKTETLRIILEINMINFIVLISGILLLFHISINRKNEFKLKWLLFFGILTYSLFIPFGYYRTLNKITNTTDYYGVMMIKDTPKSVFSISIVKINELYHIIYKFLLKDGKNMFESAIKAYLNLFK